MKKLSKTATFIKQIKSDKPGHDIALYKLSHPLAEYDYIVVSAIPNDNILSNEIDHLLLLLGHPLYKSELVGKPETYIFGSDKDGHEPTDWEPLKGSFKGGMDHKKALNDAGYEVILNK